MDRNFDLIVCTGALHHLADPDAGLAALRSVLKPHGAMYLMVYARYGRTSAYMLQEYCRRLGIGTSEREIHETDYTFYTLLLPGSPQKLGELLDLPGKHGIAAQAWQDSTTMSREDLRGQRFT